MPPKKGSCNKNDSSNKKKGPRIKSDRKYVPYRYMDKENKVLKVNPRRKCKTTLRYKDSFTSSDSESAFISYKRGHRNQVRNLDCTELTRSLVEKAIQSVHIPIKAITLISQDEFDMIKYPQCFDFLDIVTKEVPELDWIPIEELFFYQNTTPAE